METELRGDAANVASPGAPFGGRLQPALLIGAAGGQHVAGILSTHDPAVAIDEVQRSGALRDPACEPLLGLLDHIGQPRAEVYFEMLNSALAVLQERVATMPQPALLRLLEAAFPFIGIEEVREIPLAVLSRLNPVPPAFLKQLAGDIELFRQLPRGVQRQVWELDGALFRRHASPSISAYADETATIMRELDMGLRLTALPKTAGGSAAPSAGGKAGAARPLPVLPRRALRSASASVQRLVKLVGSSKRLYASFVSLCRQHYGQEGLVAACSLRSQVLLALHETKPGQPGGAPSDVSTFDRCFELARDLDACVKDGYADEERLKAISAHVEKLERDVESASASRKSVPKFRLVAQGMQSENSDGGASVSRPEDTPATWLADAGLILRDPPVLHLLLHETVRTLQSVVEREAVPKEDAQLRLLTKLLSLAAGTQDLVTLLVEKKSATVPAVNRDVIEKFFPLLADLILEAQLRDSDDEAEVPDEADAKLVSLLQQDAVIRKVALAYIIQRLMEVDLASAKLVLLAVTQALPDSALMDEGPFAATLARQLAALCSAGKLLPESSLWKAAVDGFLLRAASISMEVHEEVLRLLLAAASAMTPTCLAQSLEAALQNTRRSRKQHKRRRVITEYEYEPGAKTARPRLGESVPAGYSSPGGGYASSDASDGSSGFGGGKANATDGVRATYALIATKEASRLNEELAPKLFAYLRESAQT